MQKHEINNSHEKAKSYLKTTTEIGNIFKNMNKFWEFSIVLYTAYEFAMYKKFMHFAFYERQHL